jgi:type II secretory ATPase GspE/PulE/Tfp pilus assembly ATPase PilB-like protein
LPIDEAIKLYPALNLTTNDKIFKGTGCINCKKTGYSGRTGIYETFMMDDEIRVLVSQKISSATLKAYCVKNQGMVTMRQDGLEKVKLGLTTYEEVKRVMGEA